MRFTATNVSAKAAISRVKRVVIWYDEAMETVRNIWMITLGILFLSLMAIAAYYRGDLENHPRMGMVFMLLGYLSTIVFFGGILLYIGGAVALSIVGLFS